MRVFVAGASGALGRRLLPLLAGAGHEVTGMTRTPAKKELVRSLGAEPVVCDALDREALRAAAATARPEVVVHALTAIPPALDPRRLAEQLAENDRLRTVGTPNLVDAAVAAGARRIVAESIAFAYAPTGRGPWTEDDPLGVDAPPPFGRTIRAVRDLERAVTSAAGIEGVVLRFGSFYGPGTHYAPNGSIATLVERGRYPIIGRGAGVTSFVHVDDAASAVVRALDHGSPGVYNIVDDEPAALADWLPAYAAALGAKAPRRLPEWLARIVAGPEAIAVASGGQGASNAKARRELGWEPLLGSWREGFTKGIE